MISSALSNIVPHYRTMGAQGGIQSVNKALGILSLFTYSSPYLGVTETSHALKLPKSTVHGLIRTLEKLGFLQQHEETRKYHLGLKICKLGVTLVKTLEINQKSAAPAYHLAKRCRLTCRIAIWDGECALVTSNAYPGSHSLFSHQIGPRIPAYCTGLGKAILAFLEPKELSGYLDRIQLVPYTSTTITQKKKLLQVLEETYRKGYSIDHEETVLGLVCIGAPIFGLGGRLEASISLSGDPDRIHGKETRRLAKELLKTASEISRSMGYFPESLGVWRKQRRQR